MKTVIMKLVEIDRAAREMVEQARVSQQQAEEALSEELKQMEKDYDVRISQRIAKNKERYQKDTEERISEIEKKAVEKRSQLEQQAEQQREQLEKTLFLRCIGR